MEKEDVVIVITRERKRKRKERRRSMKGVNHTSYLDTM
jgi:hypothetical protein